MCQALFGKNYYANVKKSNSWKNAISETFTESDLFGKDVGFEVNGSTVETITVTAKSVYDTSVTGTATITMSVPA